MSDKTYIHPDRMVRLGPAAAIVQEITGERPHKATLYRWASRGLRGVRLRTAFAGGHRRTTEAWVREFFDAVTAAADGNQASHLPGTESRSDRRTRSVAAAARTLEAAGI